MKKEFHPTMTIIAFDEDLIVASGVCVQAHQCEVCYCGMVVCGDTYTCSSKFSCSAYVA